MHLSVLIFFFEPRRNLQDPSPLSVAMSRILQVDNSSPGSTIQANDVLAMSWVWKDLPSISIFHTASARATQRITIHFLMA